MPFTAIITEAHHSSTKGPSLTHLSYSTLNIGPYQGNIAPEFDNDTLRTNLACITNFLKSPKAVRLSNGVDYVVRVPINTLNGEIVVALKVFKRQSLLKDRFDQKNKSKAERSFNAAAYLKAHEIGTPAPVAWLDRWENNRLIESYFLSIFQPAICFRDALTDLYNGERDNALLMELLHLVAPAIKQMHDHQFMHGDLGNQNILLPKNADGSWGQPQFIDLNRCAIPGRPLTDKERAFDLSRPILPGNYLNFFKYIYCNHDMPSKALERHEKTYRERFAFHRKSKHFRHPIRFLKNRHKKPAHAYPDPKDYWLWDEKTAQPMIALSKKEKSQQRFFMNSLKIIGGTLSALPGIFTRYRSLKKQSFKQPVVLKNRIGVALHPHDDYIEHELRLLGELGNPPILIRFCRHETDAIWDKTIALVQRLHTQGVEVMVALLQDRQAVLQPELWSVFLHKIIPAIAQHTQHIEITHAFNRIKWGIWTLNEWQQLINPAFELQKQFPHIQLTGPACIDFEYMPVIGALKSLKPGQKFSALSHLLYVDRRGAPENPQGPFATLEKCALLKALTHVTPNCDDKVIISEVNWPIENTDIWSPIVCPYVTPKWKEKPSGESEAAYANYMLRYIVIAICSGHVDQLFWWRLSAKGYGLIDDQNQFKPRLAYSALQYFFVRLGDSTFIKRWPSVKNIYVMEFQNDTQQILMLWCINGESTDLPKFDAQKTYDRDGNSLKKAVISESPIYLVRGLL